jgi:hypothetical protein
MRAVKAFLLGSFATGLLVYVVAAAVAVSAQAAGQTLDVSLGPVTVVSVAHDGTAVVTTFGAGIALLALAGGVLNACAAAAVRRRAERRADRVD